MPMPKNVPIIDTMLGIPRADQKSAYDFLKPLYRDGESKDHFEFPVEYMFKEFPKVGEQADYVAYTLALMDRFGIEKALTGVSSKDPNSLRAVREHPDRFIPEIMVDPNQGMDQVREMERLHREIGLRAVSAFPSGTHPQVPIGDKRYYPIFAKCVELGLPIFVCIGVPGPRVPMEPQHAMQLDEICWFFPELKVVVRHGGEPWVDLIVKLLLKWENLYYSTSAFAPRYFPKAIVDFANKRGADKVLYAGYFPAGLTLERSFSELPNVPFEDHVWPKFLHENARRVLGL